METSRIDHPTLACCPSLSSFAEAVNQCPLALYILRNLSHEDFLPCFPVHKNEIEGNACVTEGAWPQSQYCGQMKPELPKVCSY